MRVVIAGGGTAGHVNPAIALARALEAHDITFVGTARGAESRLVPAAGFELEVVEVRGFDRSRPLGIFPVGLQALKAVSTARRLLRAIRPNVVVGMGGYVSLPVCLAARPTGAPIVLHEQNIVLGLANRVCKPLARKVATSFEETAREVGKKGVYVGNPVLPEIANLDRDAARASGLQRFRLDPERRTLLVFGGSQGARRINEAVRGLARSWASRDDRQILHITGRDQHVSSDGPEIENYRVVEYVERMGEAYAIADLAVCRGGATTVAELGAVGLPAIIVPYPHHRDRQQERHARVMEVAGVAFVIDDADTTSERLAQSVDPLFEGEGVLERMRRAAREFGRPDAAAALADVVREQA